MSVTSKQLNFSTLLVVILLFLSGCVPSSDGTPSEEGTVTYGSGDSGTTGEETINFGSGDPGPIEGGPEVSEDLSSSDDAASTDTIEPDIVPSVDEGEGQGSMQSGTLTAADHDDLLNSSLYSDYLSTTLQRSAFSNLPYVDINQAIRIKVLSNDSSPFPTAKLKVLANEQPLFTRNIPTNGQITLFPQIDQLPDTFEIIVSNQTNDVQVSQSVDLNQLNDDRSIELTLPLAPLPADAFDLLLVIDTTGSMGDELAYLKLELTSILDAIKEHNPTIDMNVGLIVYRDIGDTYVMREFPFTNDIATLQSQLNAQDYDGGGDYPEAMDQALAAAMQFQWRSNAVKSVLLVADAPPHDDKISVTWNSVIDARQKQIHIVPLAASGVADVAEFMMRSMAVLTHSRYLFLTDDSGVGSPHNEPSVDCYIVTRLDSLVVRVMDALIGGQRIEPDEAEIIREVGNYNGGVCEAPVPTTDV